MIKTTNYFNKIECQAHIVIYDYLDKYSQRKTSLIFPCLVATMSSFAINVTTRIAAIVENIFRSSIYLIKSPFKENPFDEINKSWKIIKNIPTELASITVSVN